MIGTIGSLVQGNTNRCRWLTVTSLYVIACSTTSVLLGLLLSAVGQIIWHLTATRAYARPSAIELLLVGIVAVAYAFSDIGMIKLPRPRLMHAVPVSWWRWWGPYGAALAYGAALGIGVTTEIQFGAFYVLCLWCVIQGNSVYGALLMGTYGATRSLMMFPASWGVYQHCTDSSIGFKRLLASREAAKLTIATMLVLFGAQVLSSLVFQL